MDIITVDRADDDLVEQLWKVDQRSTAASRVHPVRQSLSEYAAGLRFSWPSEHDEVVAARDGGRVVGGVRVWFPERDNTDKCWWDVFVDPGARGRGVGSALLDHLEETARSEKRTIGLPEVYVPVGCRVDHPAARFAERRGYTVSDVEVVRVLPLPVATELLDGLEEQTRNAGGGYDIALYRGGVPEPLRPGLCELSNRLIVDAPTGDVDFEAETMTPSDYQLRLDHEASIGWERLTALATQRATGEVVAYSDLLLPQGDPDIVYQLGTLVTPKHRGHRLGLAVKVANLRQLSHVDPARTRVETMNAEDNPWMVQINVDLGFEIVEEALMLRKDL